MSGQFIGTFHPGEATLASAVTINQQGRSFSRASQAWDPVSQSFKSNNVARQRTLTTPGGLTFTADLIEKSSSNIATSVQTSAYSATSTATWTVWWDGAVGDYTITASTGTPSAQPDTADGRHWCQIPGVTASSTITCTRAGGASNTHLQVENSYHPTSKIALGGSRAAETLTWSYNGISQNNGTFLYVIMPYGYDGWPLSTIYRHSGANPLVQQTKPTTTASFALNDGAGASKSAFAPLFLFDMQTTHFVGTYDSTKIKAFAEGYTAGAVSQVTSFTYPWQALSSGNIGAAGGGSTPSDSYELLLYWNRVLSDTEIADVCNILYYSNLDSTYPRISTWGDSLTYGGSFGIPYQTTLQQQMRTRRIYNGGTDSETSTQIMNRFLAAPEKWKDIHVIWVGRNDYNSGTTVKANIATMVSKITSGKYVILGVTNDSTQTSGGAAWTTITNLNNDLAALYPNNFIDIRAYWISQYDPGNSQDVTDHTNDVPPSSLRNGSIHPNTSGFYLIGLKIAQFIQSKGW